MDRSVRCRTARADFLTEKDVKIVITIYADETGLRCSADANDASGYSDTEANVFAIGALEIARASLLARRWGINISGMGPTQPLVKDPVEPNVPHERRSEGVPLNAVVGLRADEEKTNG